MAQSLEDITLRTETNRVVATIKMSMPLANVRYTPTKKGTILNILFNKVPSGSTGEAWQDGGDMKSPPSSLIPSFKVKTNISNIQPKLIIEFSREAEYTVNLGRDGRSIIIGIKIDQPLPVTIPDAVITPRPPAESTVDPTIPKQAYELMALARVALAKADNIAAIDAFNKLLLLPPNDYTQEGQEWVGVARERAGQLDKAKLEYELYLKLYPSGDGANRVKSRLANLGTSKPQPSVAEGRTGLRKRANQTLTYGSISTSYYNGASKIDTEDTILQFGNASLTKSSFSGVDQSALLTSVAATERFISDEYDNRIVFRDTAYANFLPGQTSKNRLGSAYVEIKNRFSDYSARLGRQSSSGGGVLGRFDGAAFGYGLTSSIRINAVAGQLSDQMEGSRPTFVGTSLDMGSVTVYAINQTIDGVLDRQAVGTEFRYFKPTQTAFLMLDYDISYATLNTAMFQGTYTPFVERTYNLLLDHRRAPYMSTRNALYGAGTTQINDLLNFLTEDGVRQLAVARTGTSNLAQLGMTQQVSEKWQVGGDIRASSFDGLPASGISVTDINNPLITSPSVTGLVPETPGTGIEWAITLQLIGNSLYSSRDVTVFSFSYMSGQTYNGQSFYIYSRGFLTDKWSLDVALQLYRQDFNSGMLMTRTMPTFRTSYQLRQALSLDAEVGVEISHTENATQKTNGQRQFFSIGLRWDF